MTSRLTDDQTEVQREALARLLKLAEEQGVRPFDLEQLRAKADFWPDDESIDDFIASIRRWRDEEDVGSHPGSRVLLSTPTSSRSRSSSTAEPSCIAVSWKAG